jgi:hypothetical protein
MVACIELLAISRVVKSKKLLTSCFFTLGDYSQYKSIDFSYYYETSNDSNDQC